MRQLYLTIFLTSCSVLMFEISLTRIFSIRLWYHFAFMVISIAMLGIGSAGTLLAVCSGGIRKAQDDSGCVNSKKDRLQAWICAGSSVPLYAALTGVSILLCYVISNYLPFDPVKFSWEKKQFLYLALYCVVLSAPFFFSGLLIAAVFSLHSEESMFVYSADLIGAGTGSLAVLYLLNRTSPEYAVVAGSALCLAGALFTGRKYVKLLSLFFLVLNLVACLALPGLISVKLSPYKRLSLLLKYPGAEHLNTYHSSYSRIDTFRSPGVRFAPGLSLTYLDPLPEQIGLAVDGDSVSVITSAADAARLRFLEFLPSSITYELANDGEVLVIDPRGGLHILMARHYGFRRIHAVESNPLLYRIPIETFNDFSGGIYAKDTHTGFARNYLGPAGERGGTEYADGRYDIIDIPMTDTSVSGLFGISEDYKYTVEAFKIYLAALKQDGILSMSTYLIPPPRTEFRLLSTVLSAFAETGIHDGRSRIAAIRSWDSMTLIAKKSPFTSAEIEMIKNFCNERLFDLMYYPGMREGESNVHIKMAGDEYASGFSALLDKNTKQSFTEHYLFDIKPVRDDNPFFHYYLKMGNIKPIYEKMGQKWLYFIEEGYLLPVVLLIILALCVILILSPVIVDFFIRKHFVPRSALSAFIYFSMLGLGFMFVEVSLIQKTFRVIENPSYTVAFILTSILLSSGIGSMISSRFHEQRTHYAPLMLSALVLLYSVVYPYVLDVLSFHRLQTRIVALSVAIIPLGFFMGVPFPAGMKILGRKGTGLIPWAWAINACMSVLAPILTIMLALITGFKAVLWLGAAAYAIAFIAVTRLRK